MPKKALTKEDIVSEIRSLKSEHGWTYDDLSKYFEVGTSTINRWLRGDGLPSDDLVDWLNDCIAGLD